MSRKKFLIFIFLTTNIAINYNIYGIFMTLGERIKRLRKERDYSQEQLAQKLDTAKSLVWKYEKDMAVPSAEMLKRMALAFGVSADYLLFDEAEKQVAKITDKKLLRQFEEIDKMDESDKIHIRYFLDLAINNQKLKQMTV